jgi:hypothetical protein
LERSRLFIFNYFQFLAPSALTFANIRIGCRFILRDDCGHRVIPRMKIKDGKALVHTVALKIRFGEKSGSTVFAFRINSLQAGQSIAMPHRRDHRCYRSSRQEFKRKRKAVPGNLTGLQAG